MWPLWGFGLYLYETVGQTSWNTHLRCGDSLEAARSFSVDRNPCSGWKRAAPPLSAPPTHDVSSTCCCPSNPGTLIATTLATTGRSGRYFQYTQSLMTLPRNPIRKCYNIGSIAQPRVHLIAFPLCNIQPYSYTTQLYPLPLTVPTHKRQQICTQTSCAHAQQGLSNTCIFLRVSLCAHQQNIASQHKVL